MAVTEINLAEQFSRFPGGRFRSGGPYSGQEFREDYLQPALERQNSVCVSIDNVAGLPASFLEEAFGGLVREGHSVEDLVRKLTIISNDERFYRYHSLIKNYIVGAGAALKSSGG
jgi:STAS-like domain of unknown function (DUF4325)